MEYLQFLNLFSISEKWVERGLIEPCSTEDIMVIESKLGKKLPKAYEEFLLILGKKTGPVFDDSDMTYPFMYNNGLTFYEIAQSIIIDSGSDFMLDNNSFVFSIYLQSFLFFNLNESPNPPVYVYVDGDECPLVPYLEFNSFTDFIGVHMKAYLTLHNIQIPDELKNIKSAIQ